MTVMDRLKHAWDAFTSQGDKDFSSAYAGGYYGSRPDRIRYAINNERSIIASIYTRLAVDLASHDLKHVRMDDQGRYNADIVSDLNECLTVEANLDQAASHFLQDICMSLLNHGVIAVVPIRTTLNPSLGTFDIKDMRVAEIVQWYPEHIRVNVYDQKLGVRREITLEKKYCAVIENPFYSVMNEPNSTLQRLIRKLNLLDVVDEQTSSGKLDIIIQLPYVVKSEARRAQAEARRKDIEVQLKGSQYGIAYTDGTERITQLNRPAENRLLGQIEYLMKLLYSQTGLTEEIMNGTADASAMLNYYNRTIEPILRAIQEAMVRSFLTKTARTQRQSIMYFRDPFKLVPVEAIAEIADKFTRNEIATGNEIRSVIGMMPSKDPKADELHNSNMPRVDTEPAPQEIEGGQSPPRRMIEARKPTTVNGR